MSSPTKNKQELVELPLDEVRKLFEMSNQLADTAENILEAQGDYSPEFLEGLKTSLQEAKDGNLKKVSLLKGL